MTLARKRTGESFLRNESKRIRDTVTGREFETPPITTTHDDIVNNERRKRRLWR